MIKILIIIRIIITMMKLLEGSVSLIKIIKKNEFKIAQYLYYHKTVGILKRKEKKRKLRIESKNFIKYGYKL